MASINKKASPIRTHEGAVSTPIKPYEQLRRSVCSCMLWEDTFYEDGTSIADRIIETSKQCTGKQISDLAIEARTDMKLRHVPLLLCRELARRSDPYTANTIEMVIQRPDELTELLALYWKDGKVPISSQLKKGLAKAFTKFNEYQLAKYNRDGAIKLRDVMFLCHPKPMKNNLNIDYAGLWRKLANNELTVPDTWETNLSSGKDKGETFTRLLKENKLGALALLKNLRNMKESGVNSTLMRDYILRMNTNMILPFRFISAAKYYPALEPELETAMFKGLQGFEKIKGNTALLVDHSGSMQNNMSEKSVITRFDAAGAVGIMLRELCSDEFRLFTFAKDCIEVAPRRGFAMMGAIKDVMVPTWTKLGAAVDFVYKEFPECERLIVITDEQSQDRPRNPKGRGYIINVASYENGIGYGNWKTINGFSEAIIKWINEYEKI